MALCVYQASTGGLLLRCCGSELGLSVPEAAADQSAAVVVQLPRSNRTLRETERPWCAANGGPATIMEQLLATGEVNSGVRDRDG